MITSVLKYVVNMYVGPDISATEGGPVVIYDNGRGRNARTPLGRSYLVLWGRKSKERPSNNNSRRSNISNARTPPGRRWIK